MSNEKEITKKRKEIREIIENAGSQFLSVQFVKKDGTVRDMKIQNAMLKMNVKGDEASETAKKATETRKKNNPNLIAVWDFDKNEIRSINMDTVTHIKSNGETHTYKVY